MTRTEQTQARMGEVYEYLKTYKRENDGCAPALAEIGAATGIKSDSHVKSVLRHLVDAGLISLGSGQPRFIKLNCGQWSCEEGEANV